MDFIGELPKSQGYNAIFVLICKLTKYTFFIPCNVNLVAKAREVSQYSLSLLINQLLSTRFRATNVKTRWARAHRPSTLIYGSNNYYNKVHR